MDTRQSSHQQQSAFNAQPDRLQDAFSDPVQSLNPVTTSFNISATPNSIKGEVQMGSTGGKQSSLNLNLQGGSEGLEDFMKPMRSVVNTASQWMNSMRNVVFPSESIQSPLQSGNPDLISNPAPTIDPLSEGQQTTGQSIQLSGSGLDLSDPVAIARAFRQVSTPASGAQSVGELNPIEAAIQPASPSQQPIRLNPGDTLWKVAEQHLDNGDRWTELKDSSGKLFNPEKVSQLPVGTEVYLPSEMQTEKSVPPESSSGSTSPSSQKESSYTIAPGDTLWGIAQQRWGNGNLWTNIKKEAGGSSFTEAEAQRLQPNQTVYLSSEVGLPQNSAPTALTTKSASPIGQEPIAALRSAIIGQESGGNFQARNATSGALGIGQIMPGNIPSWSREALGREISPKEFLANPDAQLQIIDHKLNQYYQAAKTASGGDTDMAVRRVASAWYSGNPDNYNSSKPQGGYPSIANYTSSILKKFNNALNTSAPAAAVLVSSERPSEEGRNPHKITPGQTLWGIAQETWGDGSLWNKIQKADHSTFTEQEAQQLQADATVYLPSDTAIIQAPAKSAPSLEPSHSQPSETGYKVQPGDTLWSVAEKLGYKGSQWQELRKEGGGLVSEEDARSLQPGAVILPPAGQSLSQAEGLSLLPGIGDIFNKPTEPANSNPAPSVMDGDETVTLGDDSRQVTLKRWDGSSQAIDPNQETVVVVHGWKGSAVDPNIQEIAKEASRQGVQVLTLDWSSIAKAGFDPDLPIPPYNTAKWIAPVGEWAHDKLQQLAIDPNKLTLVGHSFGAYVSAELAAQFGDNKVKNLVALDPASPAADIPLLGGTRIPGYDVDGRTQEQDLPKTFRNVAKNSLSFVAKNSPLTINDKGISVDQGTGGLAGDNDQAATANNSFVVDFPEGKASDAHTLVVDAFIDALEKRHLTVPDLTLPYHLNDWYSDNGNKQNVLNSWLPDGVKEVLDLNHHEGRISADANGKILGMVRVIDSSGTEAPVSTWT